MTFKTRLDNALINIPWGQSCIVIGVDKGICKVFPISNLSHSMKQKIVMQLKKLKNEAALRNTKHQFILGQVFIGVNCFIILGPWSPNSLWTKISFLVSQSYNADVVNLSQKVFSDIHTLSFLAGICSHWSIELNFSCSYIQWLTVLFQINLHFMIRIFQLWY